MKQARGVRHAGDTAAPAASVLMTSYAAAGGVLFALSLGYFLSAYFQRYGRPVADGPVLRPVAVDVVLFSAFALHHSVFARTPVKAWIRRVAPPALERSTYVWIASLMFLGACWLWQPVPGVVYRLDGTFRFAAYAAQAAGLAVTVLGARALDALELAGIRQVLHARSGTADAGAPLSTTGVFGIVRHPLYFGWALLVCGAPDMTATRAVFALVSTAYVAMAIPWEERGLVETFGAEYERYRRRVRWRMIPFLY